MGNLDEILGCCGSEVNDTSNEDQITEDEKLVQKLKLKIQTDLRKYYSKVSDMKLKLRNILRKYHEENDGNSMPKDELQKNMDDFDPLCFFPKFEVEFPAAAIMAIYIHSNKAGSGGIERFFKVTGSHDTRNKNRQTMETLNKNSCIGIFFLFNYKFNFGYLF